MTLELSALPPGWVRSTVEELGDPSPQVVTTGPFGTSMGRGDFVSQGVPVLTIGCLTQSGLDMSKAMHVSPEKAASLGRYRLKQGDLLFSRMASVGRMGTVGAEQAGALFNYHIMRLRLRQEAYESGLFVAYVRGSRAVTDYLREVNHGATRDGINTEQLLSLPVKVPPRREQARILGILDEQFPRLDAAVAGLVRVEANLKRYRASVLKAAVEGRLVLTEAELAKKESRPYEPASFLLARILKERRRRWEESEFLRLKAKGEAPKNDKWKERYEEPPAADASGQPVLPEGWCWASLEALTSAERPICYGILMPKDHVPGGVPYVKVRDMRKGRLTLDALQRTAPEISARYPRSVLKGGDLLIAIRGTFGRVVEVPPELEGGNITQDSARLDLSRAVDARYIKAALLSPVLQTYFKRVSRGVAVKGVNIADLRLTPIAVPPAAEQERIVDEVEDLMSIAEVGEERVGIDRARLARLRQSILKWAFEGKLVDQDPNDEPAAAMLARIKGERLSAKPKAKRAVRAKRRKVA